VPVTKHRKLNIDKWLLAREEFRKKPGSFPNTLSFESWCCVTSYDVQKQDGGPHFQRLMAYLLTESTSTQLSTIETDIAKKARPPDSYYTTTGWPKNQPRANDTFKNVYVSQTAAHTKQTYRSGSVGNRSNAQNNKVAWLVHGKEPNAQLSTSVPIEAYSKAAWLIAAGVTPVQRPGEHSSAWGFTTNGNSLSKSGNMGQRNGKVAAGNLTAQIFGLYWYPDCNKPENNWSMGDVRMHMFNPSYVFYDGDWRLRQPLHSDNGERGADSIMGGVGGFPLPKLVAMDTVLENMLFIQPNKDTGEDKNHFRFRLENWLCPVDF
jgi:hypothetical protein